MQGKNNEKKRSTLYFWRADLLIGERFELLVKSLKGLLGLFWVYFELAILWIIILHCTSNNRRWRIVNIMGWSFEWEDWLVVKKWERLQRKHLNAFLSYFNGYRNLCLFKSFDGLTIIPETDIFVSLPQKWGLITIGIILQIKQFKFLLFK